MASLRTACSVGPPTVSDTISPPDQLSVDGDYVFIFGTSTVIFSYQQNGKTFAIRQPNDRVASVSTRFLVFFGDGMAPVVSPSACECSVNSSSPLGGNPFCARRRFDSFLIQSQIRSRSTRVRCRMVSLMRCRCVMTRHSVPISRL